MKKILLAFDGDHFSEGAFEFARGLNKENPILLTGVFLPQSDFSNLWSYSGGGRSGSLFIPLVENQYAEEVAKNIDRFKSLCSSNNIDYSVHQDFTDFVLPGLKYESRFADLLIIGSESFYENLGTSEPNSYIEDTLHDMECPVIITPENFVFPQNNILTYDGSDSSVHAIKQFAYLFPELAVNPTMIVYLKEGVDNQFPDEIRIEELAGRHFPDLTFFNFNSNRIEYFNAWLLDKRNAILVSGSYGRSGVAKLFHKSFANDIIRAHSIPVFITHLQ